MLQTHQAMMVPLTGGWGDKPIPYALHLFTTSPPGTAAVVLRDAAVMQPKPLPIVPLPPTALALLSALLLMKAVTLIRKTRRLPPSLGK